MYSLIHAQNEDGDRRLESTARRRDFVSIRSSAADGCIALWVKNWTRHRVPAPPPHLGASRSGRSGPRRRRGGLRHV